MQPLTWPCPFSARLASLLKQSHGAVVAVLFWRLAESSAYFFMLMSRRAQLKEDPETWTCGKGVAVEADIKVGVLSLQDVFSPFTASFSSSAPDDEARQS